MYFMNRRIIFYLDVLLVLIGKVTGIASPLRPSSVYEHTIELQKDIAQVWWTVNDSEQDITFELHVKTTGWIALGISPGRK